VKLNNYDNEKLLVNALTGGDEDAYRHVIALYREPVVRLCRGFTGSPEDAEDLAQDIFLEVFRSINKFRSRSSLSTWIYRIAVNKSLNFIRDRKKAGIDEHNLENNIGAGSNADYSADTRLEQKEHAEALHNAIDRLPESQRAAFILSKYEDLKYSEIADIMKTTKASVESLLFRAKRNLQDSLRDYYEKNFK
jgi:RNA polymerase sigma-70 factor (ECF subfamily)